MVYLLVPIGERHHDVQRCRHKHHVEQAPRVGHTILLVVPHLVDIAALSTRDRLRIVACCQHLVYQMKSVDEHTQYGVL